MSAGTWVGGTVIAQSASPQASTPITPSTTPGTVGTPSPASAANPCASGGDRGPVVGSEVPSSPSPSGGTPHPTAFASPQLVSPSPSTTAAPRAGFCISDLLAAPRVKVRASDVSRLSSVLGVGGSLFKSHCIPRDNRSPSGVIDHRLFCLYALVDAWRAEQVGSGSTAVSAEGFQLVLTAYQFAADQLGPEGKAYLDDSLAALDLYPPDWQRPEQSGLVAADNLRNEPVRKTSRVELHRLLADAWAATLVLVLDGLDGARRFAVGSNYPRPFAKTNFEAKSEYVTIVAECERVIDWTYGSFGETSQWCGEAAGFAWLMYQATGDDRFRQLTIGIQDLALRSGGLSGDGAAQAKKANEYFRFFRCNVESGSSCY